LTADDLPLGLGPLSDEDYEALVEAVEEMSQPVTPPKPKPTPKPKPKDPPAPKPKDPPTPPAVADPKDKPLTKKYQGGDTKLTFLDLPEHRRATDTTDAVMGFGRSTTTEPHDVLSKMTVGDQILLLAGNNIHLSAKTTEKHKEPIGSMPGYRMLAHDFRASDESVVRFSGVRILSENTGRIDNFSYAYRQFSSALYKKFSFGGSLGGGVPDIFDFSTSASHKTGIAETNENIELHFQASQTIPKVRVVFDRDDISVDEIFVKKIEGACNNNNVEELLKVLQRSGEFVPLSITLGGRIIISESKTIASKTTFDEDVTAVQGAAEGKYEYDGVTIDGHGDIGLGRQHERETNLSDQQKRMTMTTVGGDERAATSLADELGTHWIDTVAPFLNWKIIAFEPKSLVPVIDLLKDKACLEKCKVMLRNHFVAHLGIQKGATAGARGDQTFERDPAQISRLIKVIVNHDGNVDGLKLTYEIYPGPDDLKPRGRGAAIGVRSGHSGPLTMDVQDKVGNGRGDRYDSSVPEFEKEGFSPGETITTIMAKVDTMTDPNRPILRQLQFITNRGRIFPNVGEYYGKKAGDKIVEITADRVRGLHGSYGGKTGGYVHSLGFVYLKLDNTVTGRDYLLAMEPYLFPHQNYGAVTKMAPA
jgi:hypothetical protein